MPFPVQSHLSTLQTDPIRNFRFVVNINHVVGSPADNTIPNLGDRTIGFTLGFTSVEGFSAQTNAIPYRSGGMNTTPQQIPGQTTFQPITLSRGLLLGTRQNFDWFRQIFAVTTDYGTYRNNGGRGFRADMTIHVLPHPQPNASSLGNVMRVEVYNAWPSAISYGSLNAGDNSFVVETMTLAHEGWNMNVASTTQL